MCKLVNVKDHTAFDICLGLLEHPRWTADPGWLRSGFKLDLHLSRRASRVLSCLMLAKDGCRILCGVDEQVGCSELAGQNRRSHLLELEYSATQSEQNISITTLLLCSWRRQICGSVIAEIGDQSQVMASPPCNT